MMAALGGAADEVPEAPAHRVSEPLRIDGVLDEPGWTSVAAIGRLLQQEPNPESDPTEETDVRVLMTGTTSISGSCAATGSLRPLSLLARPRRGPMSTIASSFSSILFDFRNGLFSK
jgi:hypothetical protein